MVCTFGDLTDVDLVARAGPAGALGARPRRAPAPRCRGAPPGWESRGPRARARASYGELQGRTINQARRRIVELLERVGRPGRRAAAGDARGEVLREGRAAGRDHHQPPVVHPHDRAPRRADRARARAALAPAVHARALRGLGQRAHRRLVRQPPALLRRAVPALVPARRQRARCSTSSRSRRARSSCRSTPRPTCPTATSPSSAAQPGGFAGDPDVMDTWATSSLTPQIAGGSAGEDDGAVRAASSRWTCARRRTTSSAPGCSRRSCARTSTTACCRGATPRSPAGCSTPTARRCPSPRATSSRRCTCSRSTAPTPCATGPRAGARAPTRPSTRSR